MKKKILNLFVLLLLVGCMFCTSCSANSGGGDFSDGGEIPNNATILPYFETTNRGVYLRWNDVTNKTYNVFYSIEYIVSATLYETDVDVFTLYPDLIEKTETSLPTYDFTPILRDISLFVYFRVKVSTSTFKSPNIACFTYDVNKIHFTTAPIPTNVVNNNNVLTWDKVEGVSEFKISLKLVREDTSTKTIFVDVNQNRFDLSNYVQKDSNYLYLLVSICSIGTGSTDDSNCYFHDSVYTEPIKISI